VALRKRKKRSYRRIRFCYRRDRVFYRRGRVYYRKDRERYRSTIKIHKRNPPHKRRLEKNYKRSKNLSHNLD